jgi:acyl dehydratase
MTSDNFPPPDDRYFEDYIPGHVQEFGSLTVTESEIIAFARQFDPQYFHVDPVRARSSRFGGVIASGWHTTAIVMRLYVEHYLSSVASMASPGVDEIRWPNPVRPGDTLKVRVTILESRISRSKPDRGIVRSRLEALNQKDEIVLSMIGLSIIGRRPVAG